MQIIKALPNPQRTEEAIEKLTTPDTVILADIANRETPNAGHQETLFHTLHNELRSMGIRLAETPCPYGDYTVAGANAVRAIAENEGVNAARAEAGLKTKIPIQKLDLVQPCTIAVDIKSSATELYSNLKFRSDPTCIKIRRAAQVGVRLYWLVVDDTIVDSNPSEWIFTGCHSSWRAWNDLYRLISAVERANPHLEIYFCRRSDVVAVLARMLAADYTPVPELSDLERITYDVAFSTAAARIRAWENQREISVLRKQYDQLMALTAECTGLTPEELAMRLSN